MLGSLYAFKIEMKKMNTFVFDACTSTQLEHDQTLWVQLSNRLIILVSNSGHS